jgi:hypothetical protein
MLAPGQRRTGPEKERPQLLIARVLPQQLLYAAYRLLDPRLTTTPELAVDDAAPQAVPVTLEVMIGGDQEFVFLVVSERSYGISPPH